MVRKRNIILFNIGWNTENCKDKSTTLSLGNMKSLNCFILLRLDRRWSVERLDLEAASGVRMYSFRRPYWISSSRYFQRAQ